MAQRVAIVGGGFSGVMTAVNLARLSRRPMEITVINHGRPAGRGVAYGTRRMEHLLNVAARNMSAFPDLPDHFVNWLRTRSEYDTVPDLELRGRFIPRRVFGDYLCGLMQQYLQFPAEAGQVRTRFVDAEAVDVRAHPNKARKAATGVVIKLADGGEVEAGRVVLATGNEPPAELPGTELLAGHPAWLGNPWEAWEPRLPPQGGTLVLLGTGLTTVDAIVSLRALGWQGVVHAVSRHGWLPHSHFRGIDYPAFPPAKTDLATLGLKKLLALVERHCAKVRKMEAHPGVIVDKMRPYTQRIWQHFTLEERLEFARHHAARWNVMRHRIAPDIHAAVTMAQLAGQLHVHAANIERLEPADKQVRVHLSTGKSLLGDLVMNATGPHTKFTATRSVLLQNLLRRGLVTPDDMGMGTKVDPDHTIIDKQGRRSPVFLALGPLLRGTLWETIAVPELRGQARRVAETLLDQTPASDQIAAPVMMEYII